MKIVIIHGQSHEGSTYHIAKNGWNKRDIDYRKEKGWVGKKRPWKK